MHACAYSDVCVRACGQIIRCTADVPFGPTYFHEKLPEKISSTDSALLATEMVRVGRAMCDEAALGPRCKLLDDPRRSRMYPDLETKGAAEVRALLKDPHIRACLVEEMNVLWGLHEMTSEGAGQWLGFLEGHQPVLQA